MSLKKTRVSLKDVPRYTERVWVSENGKEHKVSGKDWRKHAKSASEQDKESD